MAIKSKGQSGFSSQLSYVFLLSSFLSLSLFAYTTVMLVRLSPVYQPVECTTHATSVSAFTTDEKVSRGSSVSRSTCTNPNPYAMHLNQVGSGDLFIKGSDGKLRAIGRSVVPIQTLPAHSEGTERSLTAYLELPKDEGILSASAVQVISKYHLHAHSELNFLGKVIHVGEKQQLFCGFEFRPLESNKAGHMACAHSVEELVIPAADDAAPRTEALQMTASHLEHETRRRNTTLGGIMAMSSLLSLILLSCGLASGGAWQRSILSGMASGGHTAAVAAVEEKKAMQKEQGQARDFEVGTISV